MDRDAFVRVWRALGARDDSVFAELAARWAEPHRHYHTVEHLEECLAWLDVVGWNDEVALALYFHDVIYDPLRRDNEAESAALCERAARAAGVAEPVITRVCALIASTAQHAGCGDAALLSDIDLAILGAPPTRYDRFERDVRREYAMFDDASYARGRAKVLAGFLERLSIFQTAPFQRLEAQARDNLARALSAARTRAR